MKEIAARDNVVRRSGRVDTRCGGIDAGHWAWSGLLRMSRSLGFCILHRFIVVIPARVCFTHGVCAARTQRGQPSYVPLQQANCR
jgi:hypothetical protein